MKHFRFPAAVFFAAITLSLASCNAGTEEKTDETKTDSNTVTEPVPVPSGPASIMIIRHKVTDYTKWKAGYDAHDSSRLANGLHNYVVARGTEDSNMVLVAVRMDDVEKAKAFAASKELKERMKQLSITGTPVVDFLESIMNDTSALQSTVRVMVRHKVKDWDAWKKAFDSHMQTRTDAGLTDRVVAHSVGDTHNVTLVFAVSDMDKAKTFMKSDDLKNKMKEAGVDGPPDMFFYKVVQKY